MEGFCSTFCGSWRARRSDADGPATRPVPIFFYSLENHEPRHIHVERDDNVAKYWLDPVQLSSSHGFRSYELTELRRLVLDHRDAFLEAWYGHFGS